MYYCTYIIIKIPFGECASSGISVILETTESYVVLSAKPKQPEDLQKDEDEAWSTSYFIQKTQLFQWDQSTIPQFIIMAQQSI